MREFEGRSYDAIANRMSLSQSAVQSTLFRARQRLKSEFEEITTGERCKHVQTQLDGGATNIGTGRTRRRFLVHLRDCGDCRRHAAILGFDDLIAEGISQPTLRMRAAAFLPFGLFRWFSGAASEIGAHKVAAAGAGAVLLLGGGCRCQGSVDQRSIHQAGLGGPAGTHGVVAPAGSAAAADGTANKKADDKSSKSKSDPSDSAKKDSSSSAGSPSADSPAGSQAGDTAAAPPRAGRTPRARLVG